MSSALARRQARAAPCHAHNWKWPGTTPAIAWGTAAPIVETRNCAAPAERIAGGVTTLLDYSANNMRMTQMADANDVVHSGLLCETQIENLQIYSCAPNGWNIKTQVEFPGVAINDLYGNASAYSFRANNTSNRHYIASSPATCVTGDYVLISGFFKKGDFRYTTLSIERGADSETVNYIIDFDTNTGSLQNSGTLLIPVSYGLKNYGNGWLFAWNYVLGNNGSTPQSFYSVINLLNGPSFAANNSFLGDPVAQPLGTYTWGVQYIKNGMSYPSSHIVTGASAVIRPPDVINYSAIDNIGVGEGAVRRWILTPNYTPNAQKNIVCISNGGAATDMIRLYIDTDKTVKFESAASGGNAGAGSSSVNVCDNIVHEVLLTWRKNQMNVCVDGVWGTPDASVDIPTELDTIHECSSNSNAGQLGPAILLAHKNFKTYQPSFWDRGGGFSHVY